VVDRARRGGVGSVVEGFTQAEDPLDQLRQEGEPAARQLRDSLDRLQPGLGNPVMKVEVRDVGAEPTATSTSTSSGTGVGAAPAAAGSPGVDPIGAVDTDGPALAELRQTLSQIGQRLSLLERRLLDTAAEPVDAA